MNIFCELNLLLLTQIKSNNIHFEETHFISIYFVVIIVFNEFYDCKLTMLFMQDEIIEL